METKIKNLLARMAFFAEDGMAEAPIVAIAKDADALLKEMCRDQPEPAQQAEPVAWLKYPRKKPELMQVSLSEHLPVVLKNSGWVSEPLYAQPPAQQQAEPVARDVMALANEVRDAVIAEITKDNIVSITGAVIKRAKRIDLSVIVDRYAAQPPAVSVAVPDERAAFEAWLQENIDDTDTVRPSKEKVDAYFSVWLARAMLAAAQKGGQ